MPIIMAVVLVAGIAGGYMVYIQQPTATTTASSTTVPADGHAVAASGLVYLPGQPF